MFQSLTELEIRQIAKDKINDDIIETLQGLVKSYKESIETEKEMGLEVKKALEAKNKILNNALKEICCELGATQEELKAAREELERVKSILNNLREINPSLYWDVLV